MIIGPGQPAAERADLARRPDAAATASLTDPAERVNLLNIVNYAAIDTVVNSPTFGQVLSVRPMRSVQLNLRFRF